VTLPGHHVQLSATLSGWNRPGLGIKLFTTCNDLKLAEAKRRNLASLECLCGGAGAAINAFQTTLGLMGLSLSVQALSWLAVRVVAPEQKRAVPERRTASVVGEWRTSQHGEWVDHPGVRRIGPESSFISPTRSQLWSVVALSGLLENGALNMPAGSATVRRLLEFAVAGL
jgi:hypothetical protein